MGTKSRPSVFDCYEHAEDDEPMFVLLARDHVAPAIVRTWADEREYALRAIVANAGGSVDGREVLADLDQIAEARAVADEMEAWRALHRENVP